MLQQYTAENLAVALTEEIIAEELDRLQSIDVSDQLALMRALRIIRQKLMARIAIRDIAGFSDVPTTLYEISILADRLVDETYRICYALLSEKHGQPQTEMGEPMHLALLGMGKLGGFELNFSSDVDLILVYPARGETDGRKPLAYEEFFRRVAQLMTKFLSEVTGEGFVYRIDLRLRPFGDSGPLTCSADAFEQYYMVHGREWERYALIKARCIAGDKIFGAAVLEGIRPFVYRRYLDYSAFASLREMKRLISIQVNKKGLKENIKLGRGGIREIEFIAQAYQLIYGGRDAQLRTQSLYAVLSHLRSVEVFSREEHTALISAYDFLRKTENQLQNWDDQQTQALPESVELQTRLAKILQFGSYEAFFEALQQHRETVMQRFDALFAEKITQSGDGESEHAGQLTGDVDASWQGADGLSLLWDGQTSDQEALIPWLAEQGASDPRLFAEAVSDLLQSRRYRAVSSDGQRQFQALLPYLLAEISEQNFGEALSVTVFSRLMEVIKKICSRTVYLSLLQEAPLVRKQLVEIAGRSEWLMRYIADHPMVLDELMGQVSGFALDDRQQLMVQLDSFIENAGEDVELQLDMARQFKQGQIFRIAVCDIAEKLTLMEVSDRLTMLAEILLEKELTLAADEVQRRYGKPLQADGSVAEFGIIAFGKMGGLELGYGSDLDIVFVHNSENNHALTDGKKAVEHSFYFSKLAQKLLHRLTTPTLIGPLYEIDTRLRPSGNSGVLVSSLAVFAQYQREQAWTWEHQALCRARLVVGSELLAQSFAEIRQQVLCQSRDLATLMSDVTTMRDKMRQQLASKDSNKISLKHSDGGIVDIEFLVQFWLLAHGVEDQKIVFYSDNIRQLEALAKLGAISQQESEWLISTYLRLRELSHAQRLLEQDFGHQQQAIEQLKPRMQQVKAIWQSTFSV
jgi:glutamate-ammonia-ligase adenylyltransferase